MKLRTIIVDDEPPARKRMKRLVDAEEDLEFVGECASGSEAVESILRHRPELLFLDIQMPEMSGFEVLQAIASEDLPMVIFTTAYDEHAVRAFETHALDYLLKPFKPARFKQAVRRACQHREDQDASSAARGLLAMLAEHSENDEQRYITRLTVKEGGKVRVLKTEEIDCFESAGNYVVATGRGEDHVLRETLTALEDQLHPQKFIRISRSGIVRLEAIKELTPLFKGDYAVVLYNGKQLPLTRGLREIEKALRFS